MKIAFIAALACIGCTAALQAQEDVLRPRASKPAAIAAMQQAESQQSGVTVAIGPELGVNYSFYSQSMDYLFTQLSDSPEASLASSGGLGFQVGIAGNIALSPKWAVMARVTYDQRNTSRTFDGAMDFFDQSNNEINDGPIRATHSWSIANVVVGAAARYNITDRFFVFGGPFMAFKAGAYTRKDKLEVTGENQFLVIDYQRREGQHRIIERTLSDEVRRIYPTFFDVSNPGGPSDRISSFNSFIVGFDIGLGASLPLTPSIALQPMVRWTHSMMPLSGQIIQYDDLARDPRVQSSITMRNPTIHSLQASLALMFTL